MVCKVCGKSVRGRPSPTGVCPACRRSEAETMVRPAAPPSANTEAAESSDDAEGEDEPPKEAA